MKKKTNKHCREMLIDLSAEINETKSWDLQEASLDMSTWPQL